MTAKNELEQLNAEDKTATNRAEMTLEAAKNRAMKDKEAGTRALAEREKASAARCPACNPHRAPAVPLALSALTLHRAWAERDGGSCIRLRRLGRVWPRRV